jgi:hypothetical protein
VAEAQNSNPDLTIVHRHENASVILNEEQIARALDPAADTAFAPPDQRYAPPVPKEPSSPPARGVSRRDSTETKAGRRAPAICGTCGGNLPPGRKARFCPHCGESQAPTRCPECQSELEATWRHCVNCGAALEAT